MQFLVKLLLGQVLSDPTVKAMVFGELKKLIDDPDSTFDEKAIAVAEDIWNAVVPVLAGKI